MQHYIQFAIDGYTGREAVHVPERRVVESMEDAVMSLAKKLAAISADWQIFNVTDGYGHTCQASAHGYVNASRSSMEVTVRYFPPRWYIDLMRFATCPRYRLSDAS